MAEQENAPRLDNRRIIAIALVLVLFPTGLIISISASGGGGTVPQNACDGSIPVPYGRTECQSSACTIPIGGNACTTIVTFPIPFNVAPKPNTGYVTAQVSNVPQGGGTTVTIPQSYTTWTFFSLESGGQTWSNMPAPTTEIFGDTSAQHHIVVDWGNQTSADLVLNCPVGSSGVSATISVQYESTLASGVWTTIPGLSININSGVANCGNGLDPVDSCYSATTVLGCYVPIPMAARVDGEELRLIGSGGGGIGDNPNFTIAYITTHTSSSQFADVRIFSMKNQSPLNPPTTTQFRPTCVVSIAVTVSTVCNFDWWAWSAVG